MTALRSKRFRDRQREGKIVLTIEADEVMLTELLVAANLLPPAVDYTRAQIEEATQALLVTLAAESE